MEFSINQHPNFLKEFSDAIIKDWKKCEKEEKDLAKAKTVVFDGVINSIKKIQKVPPEFNKTFRDNWKRLLA